MKTVNKRLIAGKSSWLEHELLSMALNLYLPFYDMFLVSINSWPGTGTRALCKCNSLVIMKRFQWKFNVGHLWLCLPLWGPSRPHSVMIMNRKFTTYRLIITDHVEMSFTVYWYFSRGQVKQCMMETKANKESSTSETIWSHKHKKYKHFSNML